MRAGPVISFVVAVTRNHVIGRDGGLPWRLSSDLKRFKALTLGKPVVMGRKTWESIGRPLPGRANIVISRDPDYRVEGAETVTSLDAAIARGAERAQSTGGNEVAVIGGGEIFRQAFDRADILHVTVIEADIEGDTLFPEIDPALFDKGPEEHVPAGEKDDYPTRFATYTRRRAPQD